MDSPRILPDSELPPTNPMGSGSRSPLFAPDVTDSEEDSPSESPLLSSNPTFIALVAQKRKEREEREAESRNCLAGTAISDPDIEEEEALPRRRRVSKKAIEEMFKETQRIEKNMALAPAAHVKKRLSVCDFIANFNRQSKHSDVVIRDAKTTPYCVDNSNDLHVEQVSNCQAGIENKFQQETRAKPIDDCSDSDLEIEGKPHCNTLAPNKPSECKKLHSLTGIKLQTKPGQKNVCRVEKKHLDAELLRRAAEQAEDLRNTREAELRSKGIHIKTAEERAREAFEVEDLVERARRQAEETRRRERLEDLEESESEDWEEDGSDDGEEEKLQFSGSSDEEQSEDGHSALDTELVSWDDEQEINLKFKGKSRRTIVDDEEEEPVHLDNCHTGLSQFFQESLSTGNTNTDINAKFDKLRQDAVETLSSTSQGLPHMSILALATQQSNLSQTQRNDSLTLPDTQVTDIVDTQDSAVDSTRIVPMPPRFKKSESPEPDQVKRLVRRQTYSCKRQPLELIQNNEFVEREAAESEDEYAGLGGASDDGEDDNGSDLEDMVDDTDQKLDVNELAAFYAERDLADDQKKVQKIASDINGGFRRKRQFALADDDYDEEDPELVEIRRMQRLAMREKMIEQTGLASLANNPKKAAFLSSIEDQDDVSFLDVEEESIVLPPQTSENEPVLKKQKTMDSQSLWEMVHGEVLQADQVEYEKEVPREISLQCIVDRTIEKSKALIVDNRKMAFGTTVDIKPSFKISSRNVVPPRNEEEDAIRAKALQEITHGGRVNLKNAKSSVNYQAKKLICDKTKVMKPAREQEYEKKRQKHVLGLLARGDFED